MTTIQSKIENCDEYLPFREYSGKGIITASSKKFIFQTLISINILRDKGCSLPIELYYADENEMEPADIVALELSLDVTCINIQSFEKFKEYNARNFSIKPIALYLSSFDETIWMDADIIPMMNFEKLFDLEHYHKHNHIFFNDIFSYGKNENAMTKKTMTVYESFGITIPNGTPETDSGLYVIHKSKFSHKMFIVNALLNMDALVYEQTYGDKEMYRLAMGICKENYTTVDRNPCVIGKLFKSEDLFCGNGVILKDDIGSKLAIHMTLHSVDHVNKYNNMWKESFWTHHIIRPVDVDLKIVEPINQEILIKYEYDSKFIESLSKDLEIIQIQMFNYMGQYTNNYLL
jgi:hypothetical protein